MSRAWMPLYVGDYLGDTKRLTTLEHGAYMLLIMDYWRNGGLPDDDQRLARIAGLSDDEWRCVRISIFPLFEKNWRHKRIEKEIKKSADKSQKAKESADKLWKNKKKSKDAKAYANAMLEQQCVGNATTTRYKIKPLVLQKNEISPQGILEKCLLPETAAEVIAHRKALKKPLTAGAAKGLAKAFAEFGDAEKAASEMMLHGWQGFDPQWVKNSHAVNSGKLASSSLFFVKEETPQWDAWVSVYRKSGKVPPSPICRKGTNERGWHFPTEWPPE
jgi:uncharacterized protein YdaU (DUF1376 family)